MIEIRTDRLVLRKPKKSDKDKELLISQIGDWDVAKWLTNVPYPYTEDDAKDWFETLQMKELSLSIYLDDSLIGGIDLSQDEDELYELGYWLGKAYWGKGYATEASKGLLHFAFQKLNSQKIKSSCMKGNVNSEKVLTKLGFQMIGEGKKYCVSRKKKMNYIFLSFSSPVRLDKDNVIKAAERFNKKEEIWIPN